MNRDLRRRIAKQSQANIKSTTPKKESDTTEPIRETEIAEGTT